MKLEIKNENGIKKFNNQKVEEILSGLSTDDHHYLTIKSICESVDNYKDLIVELKKIKTVTTPTSILIIIKIIGNFNMIDAYPIFDEVMFEKEL